MKHIKWIAPIGFFWYFLMSVPQPQIGNQAPISPVIQPSRAYRSLKSCQRDAQRFDGLATVNGQIFTGVCTQAPEPSFAPDAQG